MAYLYYPNFALERYFHWSGEGTVRVVIKNAIAVYSEKVF